MQNKSADIHASHTQGSEKPKTVKIHVIKNHCPKQVNIIKKSTALQKPKALAPVAAGASTTSSSATPIATRPTNLKRTKLEQLYFNSKIIAKEKRFQQF